MGAETTELVADVEKKVKAAQKPITAMGKAWQKLKSPSTQEIFDFKNDHINVPIRPMNAAKKSIDALHKKIKKKDLLNMFKKQKSLATTKKKYENSVKEYNGMVKIYNVISKATNHDHTFDPV